jgi:peptidoglycan/LPS O-acetylase OafA/YrhL
MSYSYYLIHGLALKFFFMAIPAWVPASDFTLWAMLIPSFITTVVAGFILYLTVEHRFSLRR